jgi:putative oxidoreductase
MMSRLIYTLGRIFVPLTFVVSGYRHFMSIGALAKLFADKNVPVPMQLETWTGMPRYEVLAYAGAAIEVLCGIMVLIGFKTRFAAVVLILYLIATTAIGHDFWNMEGAAQVANEAQALQNLSIMGALLMIAGVGAGKVSFDGRSRAA